MQEEKASAMLLSGVPSPAATTYFADVENAGEMARLLKQARFATKGLGGLFPHHLDISDVHDVLDLACGPGEWALAVAEAYPAICVTGVDKSETMIQFARAISGAVRIAHFQVGDALLPFAFPDESFDLIHARFIAGFMPTKAWPKLLAECYRLLRPGGVLLLVEGEMAMTTSPAVEQLSRFFTQALSAVGQSFLPDSRLLGITPMLRKLLADSGFTSCQYEAAAMEHSAGTEFHTCLYEDYYVAFHLMQPFLVRAGVAGYEELIPLYNRMLEEMRADDFCSLSFALQVWGYKPQNNHRSALEQASQGTPEPARSQGSGL